MHTPDDPMPTAKHRQTCTHPGTINAIKTCCAAIHGTWTHLMIASQMKRQFFSIFIIIPHGLIQEHLNNHIHIYANWGSVGRFGRTSRFSTVT